MKVIIMFAVIIGIGVGVVLGSQYIRTWAAPLLERETTLDSQSILATPGRLSQSSEAQKQRAAQSAYFQTQTRALVRNLFDHINSGNKALLSSRDRPYAAIYPSLRKLMLTMEEEQGQYHFYDDFTSIDCTEFACIVKVSVEYSTPIATSRKTHTIVVKGAPLPGGDINIFVESFQ